MRALFLAMTAIAAVLPATSANAEPTGFTGISVGGGGSHHGRRGEFRRGHRGNDVVFYDNYREYQGDTAWKSDSFNDWWHDRPDRAYPRWMAANKNCERTYWVGGTWRC
jgi:hypothetical protein